MIYTTDGIKQELVMVTPDMAQHLTESSYFERQRNLSDPHIDRLATEMRKGRFMAGTQIHFAVVGRGMFCINGNHTLRAVIRSQTTIPLSFLYTECKNLTEAGELYARHDIHRQRNWSAVMKAHGMYESMSGDTRFVNAVSGAVRLIIAGLDKTYFDSQAEYSWSRDMRVKAMREYTDEAQRLHRSLADGRARVRSLLLRAAVLAVGLEVSRFQPSAAFDFFAAASKDDGLSVGDPRKALLEWLTEHPKSGGGSTADAPAIRVTASCWNAFFEDREITRPRYSYTDPFRLAGTPWKPGETAEPAFLKGEAVKPAPALVKMGTSVGKGGKTAKIAVPA